jgi:hypothetical protein
MIENQKQASVSCGGPSPRKSCVMTFRILRRTSNTIRPPLTHKFKGRVIFFSILHWLSLCCVCVCVSFYCNPTRLRRCGQGTTKHFTSSCLPNAHSVKVSRQLTTQDPFEARGYAFMQRLPEFPFSNVPNSLCHLWNQSTLSNLQSDRCAMSLNCIE